MPPQRLPPAIPEEQELEEPTTESLPSEESIPDIPTVPKSEPLEKILSAIPRSSVDVPLLTPLRTRLAQLKDLQWVDSEQEAFNNREQLVTTSTDDSQLRDDSHVIMAQSLARWRVEYCDSTYETLHANFTAISDLHQDITHLEGCENTEEHILLLNETQDTFLDILSRLDALTDELRRRQHELKVAKGYTSDDKKKEDKALREQRRGFKLDKMRLHSQCVKYIVEYGVEILEQRVETVKGELEQILGSEDVRDLSPSQVFVEQLEEAQSLLSSMNERINTLYSLLEQNEAELMSEVTASAASKLLESNDMEGAKKLRTGLAAQQKAIIDFNVGRKKSRDSASQAFADRLTRYLTAHHGGTEIADHHHPPS
jgi:hypothetical protein